MSYNNFKSRVWAKNIMRELEQESVFLPDCNREHEGEVKDIGDSVKILGIGKPTIITQVGGNIKLPDAPEVVEDTSALLLIDHVSYFDYMVGDIDKAQSKGKIMEALKSESSEGIASAIDTAIADLAKQKLAPKLSTSTYSLSESNVLSTFNAAMQALLEENVKMNTELVATVPPWVWMLIFGKLVDLDTNNSQRIQKVQVGKYGMVTFKCTNNVAKTGSVDHIMVRTKRAISAAVPKTHTEPYRPERYFADAVKGYSLYGAKIQRPKEMVVINATPATA